MKNYEEMAADIFKRRDKYTRNKKKQKAMVIKISSVMICLCLVIVISAVWLPTFNRSDPANITSTDSSGETNNNNSTDNNSSISIEKTPVILSGYDTDLMGNAEYLEQNGIDYSKYDLSSYPKVISKTLAAYMEHYKDEAALFWVSSENSFYADRFTDIMSSGLFSTKNAGFIYYKTSIGGFYALMTREEILNVAGKYKDLEEFSLNLSYNRGDKLLKNLDVRTYLQYINAKDSDYIPLRICYTKKLENEKSFDGVSWNEYLSSAEAFIKIFPDSSITKTVNGTISIHFIYREKVTKAENGGGGLRNGDIEEVGTGAEGLLYYQYDGTDYLYNNRIDTEKKAFSSKSNTEWFGYDQPSAAVRASVKKVLDNWNPGTVGFVFDSVIPEKRIELYTVLSKAQITELFNSTDFTNGNLVVQTYYSAFDKAVIEKCVPEYKWVDQQIGFDLVD